MTKCFAARNREMVPLLSNPQNCLLVQQAVAQQVQKLPTLDREWRNILGLQALLARWIPSPYVIWCSFLLCMSRPHKQSLPLSCEQPRVYHFLIHSVSLTYEAHSILNFSCPSFLILYPWYYLVNSIFYYAVQCIIKCNNTMHILHTKSITFKL